MSDHCLNLRDWEARAMLAGASVLVRPVKCSNSRLDPVGRDWPTSLAGAVANTWHFDQRYGWIEMPDGPRIHPLIERGDTAILREAWTVAYYHVGDNEIAPHVLYLSGGHRRVAEWDNWLRAHYRERLDGDFAWRTPQTMPAALARWRRPVVGVEAVKIDAVPHQTWCDVGFRRDPTLGGALTYAKAEARRTWLSTYGPGSWSGLVWVVTLGEVEA